MPYYHVHEPYMCVRHIYRKVVGVGYAPITLPNWAVWGKLYWCLSFFYPTSIQNSDQLRFATIVLWKNANFLEFTPKTIFNLFCSNSSQTHKIHLARMSACWWERKIYGLANSDLFFMQTCVVRRIRELLWLFLLENARFWL